MNLKLTDTEAKTIILRALNLPSDTVITITRNVNPNRTRSARQRMADLIKEIDGMEYRASQKIQAVKRFREVVPCGLFEAKTAIEDWETVKAWFKKNRRIPILETTDNGFSRFVKFK